MDIFIVKNMGSIFGHFFEGKDKKTTCRIGRWSPRSRTPGAAPTAPRAARPLGAAPALDPFMWKGFCHCNLQLCFSYVKHDPLNHDQGLRWQKFHEVMVDHHDTRPSRPSASPLRLAFRCTFRLFICVSIWSWRQAHVFAPWCWLRRRQLDFHAFDLPNNQGFQGEWKQQTKYIKGAYSDYIETWTPQWPPFSAIRSSAFQPKGAGRPSMSNRGIVELHAVRSSELAGLGLPRRKRGWNMWIPSNTWIYWTNMGSSCSWTVNF